MMIAKGERGGGMCEKKKIRYQMYMAEALTLTTKCISVEIIMRV